MHKTPNTVAQKRLVLASGSPRRRELVAAFDSPFDVVVADIKEGAPTAGEGPEELVLRLSGAKATGVARRVRHAIVLAADTVVALDGEVLGKPADSAAATAMLHRLRGPPHRVVTGVTALDVESGQRLQTSKSTDVTMRRYSDAEVEDYVSSGEPLDKAGGYAVQDASFLPAERVDGCYLNVVGLPMCEAVELLARLGAGIEIRPDWRPPEQCRDCPLGSEARR